MKNRNCPNKDACWDYNASNCEGCALGEKIARLVRQNKKFKPENAELRARLDKAVELPFIYEYKTYPDIDEMYCKVTYYVVYKSNDKIYTEQYIDRDRANTRLVELKGEEK